MQKYFLVSLILVGKVYAMNATNERIYKDESTGLELRICRSTPDNRLRSVTVQEKSKNSEQLTIHKIEDVLVGHEILTNKGLLFICKLPKFPFIRWNNQVLGEKKV